jgi:hypothetical protein
LLHASGRDSAGNVPGCDTTFLAFLAGSFKVNNLTERWPSGLRRTPAKRVYPKRVPRVQIPLSPPPSDRAPVAQLDRAPDYGSGGWGFKSLRARQFSSNLRATSPLFFPIVFIFCFQARFSGRCRLFDRLSPIPVRSAYPPLGGFRLGRDARRC